MGRHRDPTICVCQCNIKTTCPIHFAHPVNPQRGFDQQWSLPTRCGIIFNVYFVRNTKAQLYLRRGRLSIKKSIKHRKPAIIFWQNSSSWQGSFRHSSSSAMRVANINYQQAISYLKPLCKSFPLYTLWSLVKRLIALTNGNLLVLLGIAHTPHHSCHRVYTVSRIRTMLLMSTKIDFDSTEPLSSQDDLQ